MHLLTSEYCIDCLRQIPAKLHKHIYYSLDTDNLNDTNNDGFGDTVINVSQNSGRADAIIAPSNLDEFNEYQFSIDNVDQFTGYQIKIVANGSDEARAPRFKDLRAIALA